MMEVGRGGRKFPQYGDFSFTIYQLHDAIRWSQL